jgi:nucleoside-triphosphatase THEP1
MPPPINKLIGYQEQSQCLISDFFARTGTERFLTITGFAGVGKSALASSTIHYIQDRNILGGGCIYVNARGIHDFENLMKNMIRTMRSDPSGMFSYEQSKKPFDTP